MKHGLAAASECVWCLVLLGSLYCLALCKGAWAYHRPIVTMTRQLGCTAWLALVWKGLRHRALLLPCDISLLSQVCPNWGQPTEALLDVFVSRLLL